MNIRLDFAECYRLFLCLLSLEKSKDASFSHIRVKMYVIPDRGQNHQNKNRPHNRKLQLARIARKKSLAVRR